MDTVHRTLLGLPLALSVSLLGCGSETSTPAGEAERTPTESTSLAAPEGLTCPTGERVSTEGGSFAEWPDGADTPAEVVDAKSTPEEPWVLVGKRAYVLRPDGTAYEVHDVVNGPKGWILHGYEACAS
jgi:hypothetical protein